MIDVVRSQVMVVDSHPLFRAGLTSAIADEPDLQVAAEASTAEEAVGLLRQSTFDVAVADVLLPAGNGIERTRALAVAAPRTRILALSVVDEPAVIAAILRSGAAGYALKSQPPDEVLDGMRAVLGGARYMAPGIKDCAVARLLEHGPCVSLETLTRRERVVFDLLVHGHSNDDVAARLFISRRTVETHRHRIMKKLSAHSLLQLIRVAAQECSL